MVQEDGGGDGDVETLDWRFHGNGDAHVGGGENRGGYAMTFTTNDDGNGRGEIDGGVIGGLAGVRDEETDGSSRDGV